MNAYQTEHARIRGIYAAPLLTGDIAIDQKVMTVAEGMATGVLFLANALDMLSLVEGCDDVSDLEFAQDLLVAAAKKAYDDAQVG